MSAAEWHRRVTLIGDRHLELMLKSRSSTLAITNMHWRSINKSLTCLKFRSVVVLRFRVCRVLLKTFNVLSSATENSLHREYRASFAVVAACSVCCGECKADQ